MNISYNKKSAEAIRTGPVDDPGDAPIPGSLTCLSLDSVNLSITDNVPNDSPDPQIADPSRFMTTCQRVPTAGHV